MIIKLVAGRDKEILEKKDKCEPKKYPVTEMDTEYIEVDRFSHFSRFFTTQKEADEYEKSMGPHSVFFRHTMKEQVPPYRIDVLAFKNDGDDLWKHIVTYDTSIYVMNNKGETIETIIRR